MACICRIRQVAFIKQIYPISYPVSKKRGKMGKEEEELRREVEGLVQKYKNEVKSSSPNSPPKIVSREFGEFRNEFMPKPLNFYEKLCDHSEKILKLKPDAKAARQLEEDIRISHLNITPSGAYSLTILAPIVFLAVGLLIGFGLFMSMDIFFIFLIMAAFSMAVFQKLPNFIANSWRMSASNQMVICMFYIATYMRHTPNLENAIQFAAEHIAPPLSIDMKKILWDVETERYPSLKESLDSYLETWRKWNIEFIESFHLIEASLYEKGEERRIILIDKALDVILQETYEKMLHYAYNLKNPITMLHMLGVILPILGLVILPLLVSFMEGIRWYHLAIVYNFMLPIMVYLMGRNIMSSRPTGYGDSDISNDNPELKEYKNAIIRLGKAEIRITPLLVAFLIGGLLLFIGLIPIMVHSFAPDVECAAIIPNQIWEYRISSSDTLCVAEEYCKIGPGDDDCKIIGPLGIGASVLSLFIVLGAGLGIASYFRSKSKNVIEIRKAANELEKEFASGLFQLGNRIGDGIPAEMAFGSVADIMQDTKTGDFFSIVNNNITKLGMNLESSIFDKKNGALVYYPSKVIESSMKVLLQSSQKGPLVCSQALITISQYIKEIHRVDERLKDLLADIISSMKSQISFMAPAIAGIVVGITSMINTIIVKLGEQMSKVGGATETGGMEGMEGIPNMFSDGIPTYFFQIVVGIYVVQIVYILSVMANGIENGSDKLSEDYNVGKNMKSSTILYAVIAGIVMVVFQVVANVIIGPLSGMFAGG